MEIQKTQCDQCGATRDTPGRWDTSGLSSEDCFLSISLRVESTKKAGVFYPQPYDFCNEDCLREFLVKRHSAASAMISPEYLKTA